MIGTTRKNLSSEYSLSSIREISGFRTVPDEAVLVLAKTIPVDILADEVKRIHFCCLDYPERIAAIKVEERRILFANGSPGERLETVVV